MTKEEKIRYRVSKFHDEIINKTCCSILCSGDSTHRNCDFRNQPLAKISWSSGSRRFHLEKYPAVVATTKEQQNILLCPSVKCQAFAQAISRLMENSDFEKIWNNKGRSE